MGFTLRCFITPCDDDAEASAILAAAGESIPWAPRKRFRAPWPGVIVGYDPNDVHEDYEAHPERYPFPDEDIAYEAIHEGVDACARALSTRFPARSFAFIDVECFGGACCYEGFVARAGETTAQVPGSTGDGHVTLLKAAGASQEEWHFEPFTRGFFRDDHEPSTSLRRAIRGEVRGQLRGHDLGVFAVHLAAALRPPWQLSKMIETLLVSYGGDDVIFSLNALPDGAIDVAGRTHVEEAEAARLLDDFVRLGPADLEMSGEIALLDGEKAPRRKWRLDPAG